MSARHVCAQRALSILLFLGNALRTGHGRVYAYRRPCSSSYTAEIGTGACAELHGKAFLLADETDGKVMKVPADMTYDEWKKSLDKSDGSGIIELGSKFLSKSDPLYYNADKIKPIKGYDDIVFHGDPYHLIAYGNSGEEWLYNAKEAAEMIKHCQAFHEKPIRLIACQIGAEQDGIAQQIADEHGVVVLAPTETVFVDIDGDMFISNNRELAELWNMSSPEERKHIHQTGTWIPFEPKKR